MVFLSHTIPEKDNFPAWYFALRQAMAFGVPVFFCLSGYLITELLIREKEKSGKINLRAFYVRRALRIWPLYLIGVFSGVAVSWVRFHHINTGGLITSLSMTANWYVASGRQLPMGFGHLWSISVEEQFYLVWPILLYAIDRSLVLWASVALWIISQIGLIMLCWERIAISPSVWVNSFTHFQYFAIGAGISAVLGGRLPTINRIARAAMIFAGVGAFFEANFVFDAYLYHRASLTHTYPGYLVAGVGVLLLLLGFLGSSPKSNLLRYFGKTSYGLYVYHLPLVMLFAYIGHRILHHHYFIFTFGSLPITMLVATCSYRYLEMPFLRLKERFEIVKSRPV